MTLEDQLQGEWQCCVDDQHLDDAWSIDIRGSQCSFEGTIGALSFVGDEAILDLGDGDRFVINRQWLAQPESDAASDDGAEIPVVIESDRGTLHAGWMFRRWSHSL